MSQNLCYADAYARSIEATVVAVELETGEAGTPSADVTLDRTVFYPGGGGQPADRGTLRARTVVSGPYPARGGPATTSSTATSRSNPASVPRPSAST